MDFLTASDFPVTELHTNPGLSQDPDRKQIVIRQLLSEKTPDLVLYFGDNGQFDADVYAQMAKKFPQVRQYTYIREAYPSKGASTHPTRQGQIGFVTSAELAYDLKSKNLLSAKAAEFIEQSVYNRVLREDPDGETFGRIIFPWWQDCRDFKWIWNDKISEALQKIHSKVSKRCN